MAASPLGANPFATGARSLFGALAGGAHIEEAARQQQELKNLQLGGAQADFSRKVDEARMSAQKRLAREQTEQQLRDALPDALKGQAPALAGLAQGYATGFGDLSRGIGGLQEVGLRSDAVPALQAEGVTPANALLGALAGKPIPGVEIDSGYEVRGKYGASPTVTATPGELADIGLVEARTADVGRTGGTGSRGGRSTVNYSTPARHKLYTALGGQKGEPDPAKTTEFLRWQADAAAVDPQYRDGDFALAQFVSNNTPMQAEQFDFGAGPTSLPAGVDPDVVGQLTAVFTDRKVRGLPELTDAQKREAYTALRDGRPWVDPASRAAPAPASAGVIDRLTGVFGRSDSRTPADRAKGNAGAAATSTATTPPVPGARQAPDGNWYIPDPNRPGKYLRVDG